MYFSTFKWSVAKNSQKLWNGTEFVIVYNEINDQCDEYAIFLHKIDTFNQNK